MFDSSSMKDIDEMLVAAVRGHSEDMTALVLATSSGQSTEGHIDDEEEDVVGCITGQLDEDDAMVLLTLVVRGDQRRIGMGEKLIASFKKAAIERGQRRIETDVSSANDPALRFFAAQGFISQHDSSSSISSTVALFLDLNE